MPPSKETGNAIPFSIFNLQDRGTFFVDANAKVYTGMVIGENSRPGDLVVNVTVTKQLTNMRSAGEGVSEHFNVPVQMSLEECIEYLGDCENQ
mgnify:CR=1 FL=1